MYCTLTVKGERGRGGDVLSRIKHVLQNNAATGSVNIDRRRLNLCSRPRHFAPIIPPIRRRSRLIRPRQLPHQRIPTIVIEVDPPHIRIIKRTSTSSSLIVIAPPRPVERAAAASSARLRAAAACARERGALELLLVTLALESL